MWYLHYSPPPSRDVPHSSLLRLLSLHFWLPMIPRAGDHRSIRQSDLQHISPLSPLPKNKSGRFCWLSTWFLPNIALPKQFETTRKTCIAPLRSPTFLLQPLWRCIIERKTIISFCSFCFVFSRGATNDNLLWTCASYVDNSKRIKLVYDAQH